MATLARASEPAVEFSGLVKRFGKFTAVDGLDLKVPRGEVFGLLGPNGSGKTTAIRMLVGLERATAGSIRALGEPMPSRAMLPRIGYMPQETALYSDLSVRENLELFGQLYGMADYAIDERIEAMLKLVDLVDWEHALVHTLSGGMRHRTSLVAALLHDPELLLLDEPTVGVDPELRATFWGYFGDLAGRGKTVLITTHYMDEARQCGRIAFLRRGKLVAEGTPADIMAEADGATDLEAAFLRLSGRRGGASG